MSALGQSLKNGILFGLVVVILHITLKAALEEDQRRPELLPEDPDPAAMAAASAAAATAIAASVTTSALIGVDAEALNAYVFGSEDPTAEAASPPPPAPLPPPPPAPLPPPPPASDAPTEGTATGFALIGKYSNESELCGGSILKRGPRERSGGLQGFDGYFGSEVASII